MAVALCAIARDEDTYIDEWLQYHFKLGFDAAFIYDNGDTLRGLEAAYPGRVTVIRCPGSARQVPAYNHFLYVYGHAFEWCAMLDVDEFLVLKKHATVADFLRRHCPSGAVGVNWLLFGSAGHATRRQGPVLRRFQLRGAAADRHVKSLVRVRDVRRFDNPHFPALRAGGVQRDTSGKEFSGPANPEGPTDVAVVHHYFTKSREEYAAKAARGRGDTGTARPASDFETHDLNDVKDTSAWDFVCA